MQDIHKSAYDLMAGINTAVLKTNAEHERNVRGASEQQAQLAADLNRGKLDPRSVRLDPGTGLPVFDSALLQQPGDAYNNFPLPADARHIATVIPHSRTDLVGIFDNAAVMACVAMGVPGSEVGVNVGGGKRLAVDAQLSDGMLRNTLTKMKCTLTRCLLDVYTALYGKQQGLTVVFPSFPSTLDPAMQSLFDTGVLRFGAYKAHVCRVMDIMPDEMESTDPRLREDPLTGKKRSASSM